MTSCATFSLTSSCGDVFYFPKPEWSSADNQISKNVELINFWAEDDLETIDRGIDKQPLILEGTMCISGIYEGICMPFCPDDFCFSERLSTWLDDFKDDMNNGCKFTIDGLGACLNGVYAVKSFSFDTIKRVPDCFKWRLELERVRDIN